MYRRGNAEEGDQQQVLEVGDGPIVVHVKEPGEEAVLQSVQPSFQRLRLFCSHACSARPGYVPSWPAQLSTGTACGKVHRRPRMPLDKLNEAKHMVLWTLLT